jgi:hypothetical protein
MTAVSGGRRFSDAVIKAVSPETRKSLDAFAESIARAEGVLREYHAAVPSAFTGHLADPMVTIRENARLVFTMTWAKAILFSRAVVDSVNDGNLLVAFQSLRGYAELVAAVRFTVKRMEPLVRDAVSRGQVSHDMAQSLASHMQILLHGGRFNWAAYFEEGAAAVVDRKRLKRMQQEKAKFEMNSLRIGKCIDDWGKESPAAQFIYDYLSDLVHPNKGSNLVLLVEREGGPVFDVESGSRMGMLIFERIFPYAASMCMEAMIDFQPFFAMLGADESGLEGVP